MNSRRRKHAISIRLHPTFLENEKHIQLVDYLLVPGTKNTPVYIVMKIISLQGVIRSQIVRLGKLFYVSMEGVYFWTMGKHNDSNNDKEGSNNTTYKDNSSFTGHTGCENKGILLQIALADICSADTTKVKHYSRISFDSGSQRSYISAKARETLQLKALRTEKVIIKTFGPDNDSKVLELDVVQVNIKDKFKNRFTLIEALRVPTICSPLTSQHIASAKNIVEFKNLKFADHNESLSILPVGILVGIVFYHAFMTGRIIRSKAGPVTCGTRLGWVISGRFGASSPASSHCFETHLLRATVEVENSTLGLRDHLDKFWATENIGAESDQVVNDFENNIVHDSTRYVAKLPFKPDHEPLPDNFKVCETRLKS